MARTEDRCLFCNKRFEDGDIRAVVFVKNGGIIYPPRKPIGNVHTSVNRGVHSCKDEYKPNTGEEINEAWVVFGQSDYDPFANQSSYLVVPDIQQTEHGERIMNVRDFLCSRKKEDL